MRILLVILLAAHGVSHLVGFVVPWEVMKLPEVPYTTTLLSGRIDVGRAGIRVVGLLWLLAATAFVLIAGAWALRHPSAAAWTAIAALVSLVLCVLGWPQARIGAIVNVAILLATPLLGAFAWEGASMRIRESLAPSGDRQGSSFHPDVLTGAPAPVARYFNHVLADGQPLIVAADLEQDAEFYLNQRWSKLTARQRFVVDPPGFVWDARIALAPGLPVFVRDSYIHGGGSMRGEVAGVYPVVNQSGRRELDAGALHRYLAEAIWLPTALLPGNRLRWSPIDDRAALATITDGGTSVSLRFTFDEAGDVVEIHAPDRLMEQDGRYEPRPWTVRCTEHAEMDGLRIPVACSVEWEMPEGPMPYWRGRITNARYHYADSVPDSWGW